MRVDSVFNRIPFTGDMDDWGRNYHRSSTKVLLREPEVCRECGEVFQSLYPLRACSDHDGLDSI